MWTKVKFLDIYLTKVKVVSYQMIWKEQFGKYQMIRFQLNGLESTENNLGKNDQK